MAENSKRCTDRIMDGVGKYSSNQIVITVSGGCVSGVHWQGNKKNAPSIIVADYDNRDDDGMGNYHGVSALWPIDQPGVFILYIDSKPKFASRCYHEISAKLDELMTEENRNRYYIAFCGGINWVPNIPEIKYMHENKDSRLDE